DGTRLLTVAGKLARLWDVATGQLITDVDHEGAVSGVEFVPVRERFLTLAGKVVRLCDARTGEVIKRLVHPLPVQGLACSPDGTRAAISDADARVHMWDLEKGVELFPNQTGFPVAFNPNGRSYANHQYGGISVYDTNSGELIRAFSH